MGRNSLELNLLDRKSNKFIRYLYKDADYQGSVNNTVNAILEPQGKLLVGTTQVWFCWPKKATSRSNEYSRRITRKISSDKVTTLLEDRKEAYGLQKVALNLFDPGRNLFSLSERSFSYQQHHDNTILLYPRRVMVKCCDRQRRGLNLFNTVRTFTHYENNPNDEKSLSIIVNSVLWIVKASCG